MLEGELFSCGTIADQQGRLLLEEAIALVRCSDLKVGGYYLHGRLGALKYVGPQDGWPHREYVFVTPLKSHFSLDFVGVERLKECGGNW